MFERYTAKARRAIFYARFEASQYGTPEIGTSCLLLGILREDQGLMARLLPADAFFKLGAEVEAMLPRTVHPKISTNVDLPLSHPAKRALAYAAEESQRLQHKFIEAGHLLLGLLREKGPEADCLNAHRIELEKLRAELKDLLAANDRRPLHQLVDDLPADRLSAAATLLTGLAAEKFEVSGAGPAGPFHFRSMTKPNDRS